MDVRDIICNSVPSPGTIKLAHKLNEYYRHHDFWGRNNTQEEKVNCMEYHNCYHHNEWPWGRTVTIIIQDGAGTVEMSFEKENPGVCYVSGLSVLLSHRKQGIATYLMKECVDYCLTDNLENREVPIFRIDLNSVMEPFVLDFYHKLGFTDIKEDGGYMRMYKIIVPTKPIVLR